MADDVSPDDTARLVNLLISTWPAGVRGYVWTDVLGPMQREDAHATYLHLRRQSDKPPSVARFEEEYRARRAARRRQEVERQAALPLDAPEVLGPRDPRAIAAYERGLAQGAAEVARMEAQREERERVFQERRAARHAQEVST
jgi:hypothetical protein